MDVDANNHGKKGIAFFGVDAHIMKMVIIKHRLFTLSQEVRFL